MDNPQKHIDSLLAKYLTSQADANEKREVEKWINQNPENERIYQKLRNYIHPDIKITDNRLKIWNELSMDKKRRKSNRYWSLMGKAAAVLLFVLSILFIINRENTNSEKQQLAIEIIKKSTQPGQKLLVTLPDGSTVKLNSESEINYPSAFGDSIRSVTLIGEAFFEVEKDSLKPFIVSAGNTMTRVLGTSFNITAYQNDPDVKIALLSGKVAVYKENVGELYLDPGQFISFNQGGHNIELFNYQKTFGWKENLLIFEMASFSEVVQKLERWYGVDIIVSGSDPKWAYNGTFSNASLKEVLEVLADSQGFEYEMNKETISLKL